MDKFWQQVFGRSLDASVYADYYYYYYYYSMARQAASGSGIFKFLLQMLLSPTSFLQPLIFSNN
jgi:hypothetical protein